MISMEFTSKISTYLQFLFTKFIVNQTLACWHALSLVLNTRAFSYVVACTKHSCVLVLNTRAFSYIVACASAVFIFFIDSVKPVNDATSTFNNLVGKYVSGPLAF